MLTNLSWLPTPASDFRQQVRALRGEISAGAASDLSERVATLTTARLDEAQLAQAAKLAAELGGAGASAGFSAARLGLIGDGTLSLAAQAIIGSGLRHGLLIEVVEGAYSSAVQEAVDRTSALHQAGLDFVLLSGDARLLGLDEAAASADAASAKVESAFARLKLIAEGLRPSVASSILVQTVAPLFEPLFGSYDRLEPGSSYSMISALNARIADWARDGQVVLVDVARLAGSVGIENWDDPRHWHASKLSFAPAMLPVYADVVARTIAAVRGRSKKCLVLDLDNTLWGGVIGDDGVEGIVLGQGSAVGEAFLAVQRMARELRGRGVVLAVCSKNEDDAARKPFREHPDMLLREDDIAVFQANWTDKAANLRAIAKTLNIGVDALVFLDDNPAERAQVRRELPLTAVPELPDDPAFYPRILAAAGYFEAVSFSQEDRERAAYYQANAERAAALAATDDIDGYLRSLDMVCEIGRVGPLTRPRVAQLINKSNQFNLTTRRYSEQEVQAMEADPAKHVIQVRLKDSFGDNGIISVIIADKAAQAWEIDTWLMSCRVLGRRVEEAVLAHLAKAARASDVAVLIGRYIPSAKNRMVAEHYRKLGFAEVEAPAEGGSVWRLDLGEYVSPDLPMRLHDDALTAIEIQAA
jgi:FkbH-like protein